MPRTMTAEREARYRLMAKQPEWTEGYIVLRELLVEIDVERFTSKALADALKADDNYLLDVALTLEDSDISQLCLIGKAIREIRDRNIVALAQYAASQPEKEPNLEPR